MQTRELWKHSAKLISFVHDGGDTRVEITMPELEKDWDWRKTPDCYHMPAFSSEERLLASIGIKLDEENICIDRVTNLQEYRVAAVAEIYTVYFRTGHRKYKIAEYVRAAGRPLYYLTCLWRLSIGNIAYRPSWASSLETRVCIRSTQLMNLADWGYYQLFCSNKGCLPRDVVRKGRTPNRYEKGVARFKKFLKYTRLAVVMMMYREEALNKCENKDIPQVDRELYQFWRKCRKFVNGTLLSYL
jgi:hypothetical protein